MKLIIEYENDEITKNTVETIKALLDMKQNPLLMMTESIVDVTIEV